METVEQGTGQDAGQGIDTTIESPLKTAVTAEVLKEKWGLQTPEDVLEAQRAVDFMILSSPGFVSGFMMDVGGEEPFVSLDVLREVGFRVGRPDDARIEAMANAVNTDSLFEGSDSPSDGETLGEVCPSIADSDF